MGLNSLGKKSKATVNLKHLFLQLEIYSGFIFLLISKAPNALHQISLSCMNQTLSVCLPHQR